MAASLRAILLAVTMNSLTAAPASRTGAGTAAAWPPRSWSPTGGKAGAVHESPPPVLRDGLLFRPEVEVSPADGVRLLRVTVRWTYRETEYATVRELEVSEET